MPLLTVPKFLVYDFPSEPYVSAVAVVDVDLLDKECVSEHSILAEMSKE